MGGIYRQKSSAGGVRADVYARCQKACAECEQACAACHRHCVGMAKAGMKGHELSARLSEDCRDICALAANLCARKGPLTGAACAACATACNACGAECKKDPDMAPMAVCARSCAVCAAACRELVAARA